MSSVGFTTRYGGNLRSFGSGFSLGQVDDSRAFRPCILQRGVQSPEGPIVDDGGIVRTVEVGVTDGDQALTMIDELDFLPFRQEDIIDIGADLPCVQHLYPEDTFGGCLDGIVGAYNRWRLAAKFERDWSQIARGIGHDCASRPPEPVNSKWSNGSEEKAGRDRRRR